MFLSWTRITGILAATLFFNAAASQNPSGQITLGGRSTLSNVGHGKESVLGLGTGGQFQIRLGERVNTEWFADYFTGKVGTLAARVDYHIGWSVLYYPVKLHGHMKPYVLAGHCFDYTRIEARLQSENFLERWSSAIQGGIGNQVDLTQKLFATVSVQYMWHLGTDIHAEEVNDSLLLTKEKGAGSEGHWLLTIGIHYLIADLW